jgi:hypothetical protein
MASEHERRESLADQPEMSLVDEQIVFSVKAISKRSAGSDGEDLSEGSGDSGNISNSGRRVKNGHKLRTWAIDKDFRHKLRHWAIDNDEGSSYVSEKFCSLFFKRICSTT